MLDEKTRELIKQRRKSNKYTSNFKLAAVEKLVRNPDIPMTHISKELGVANATLWQWYNKYKKEQLSLHSEPVSQILGTQELFWVQATIGAREKDKIRYCRKHGIPYEKLKEWTELYKDERYNQTTEEAKIVTERNKTTIEQLKEENKRLKRSNKALEKQAQSLEALLELKKKVDQIFQDFSSDEGV